MHKYEAYETQLFRNLQNLEELQQIANDNGYKYLSEMIIKMYFDDKKSGLEIASVLNVNKRVVYEFLSEAGFVLRPKGMVATRISARDDFKEKDSKLNINFYQDKLKIANKMGYHFVSEAITDMYETRAMPLSRISKKFGASSTWGTSIQRKLNLKQNNVYSKISTRLSKKQFDQIKADFKKIEITNETVSNYVITKEIPISVKSLTKYLRQNK
jgi:hypothetical protein